MAGRKPLAAIAALAALALACAAALLSWLVLSSQPDQAEPEPVEPVLEVVYDEPAPSVPLYTQTDERWGGLPYADADLATSGCGLTCAAMAWQYLSGEECTPAMLLNLVGNDYVQSGQNYMPGFCSWMSEQDPTLDYTVLYESRDRALRELSEGRLVFGEMQGSLVDGGREYGGHIVLLVAVDGGEVTIHDPCVPYAEVISEPRFHEVDWGYFISIERS
ncbi:C39 family peptidase [Candidatus Collinsella stercoripullorum]|uniref:C39 family peptidase n=1 Tax=Candidatus Collinsella stercoripullorum TaxID=2838522 RepID=UPI0022E31133|nr:C39 family peptidase [Candidatus Collinsella stercoripullorum]